MVLMEHLKLIVGGWQWVLWALVGAVDSGGCRGLRWSLEQWKNIHGFVIWVIFYSFLQGWVFQGQWRDLFPPPCLGFPGAHSEHFSRDGGSLGGKTLLPARDLQQLPFTESFKTEPDQLSFANERPDGQGGGAGGKEPHRLWLQVVRWSRVGIYAPGRTLTHLLLLV